MAGTDFLRTSNKKKKADYKPDDIINDLIKKEDWILSEDELAYIQKRLFENWGSRYAAEVVNSKWNRWNEREIYKKILRFYYKKNKLPIVERRGFIGTMRCDWDQKYDKEKG